MPRTTFTVDTHLFRELGELLVKRNSTALLELIKNSYDADATRVTIEGRFLGDTKKGWIKITDDGIGMNTEGFTKGFLTIASRFKETTNRKSLKFGRRFTGAKGIGRLAAHKLAKFLEVESCPDSAFIDPSTELLHASIDWAKIESLLTLFDVEDSGAIVVNTEPRPRRAKPGTTITLSKLRKKWTSAELVQLQAEVESFQPPTVLLHLPKGIVASESLFDRPQVAEIDSEDNGIQCELLGDFESGDPFWPQVAETAHWLVEVDASSRKTKVRIRITPTKVGKLEFSDATVCNYNYAHPDHEAGPHFQARIFIKEGAGGNRIFKQWSSRSYGIRVYNESFRVLPYGEPENDWLSLDADYKSRAKSLTWLGDKGFELAQDDENEGLVFLGNSGYFGAVFLTSAGSPNLRMLVNREGFADDQSVDHLIDIMRTAIYLSVRVRAAAKRSPREERRKDRQVKQAARLELREAVEKSVAKATELAKEARQLAATGNISGAKQKIEQAATQFTEGAEVHGRLMNEGSTLRVLASVGTQMAAFVHEINSILGMAKALENAVQEIERESPLTSVQRKRMSQVRTSMADLRRGIERQASYLTDVISPDARRRRTRQKLSDRFDASCRLISSTATRRGIEIENLIPPDLKSPPMFAAELTVLFSNLLTNALKASEVEGRIRAKGKLDREGHAVVTLENTGMAVDIAESERWFLPFESTTVDTDPVLGQGMGMGLPITRNLLGDYGGTIRFCPPSRGFSTAIEIVFPK